MTIDLRSQRRLRSSEFALVGAETDWRARSACRELPTSMFISGLAMSSVEESAAKKICQGCSVTDQCLAYALAHAVPYGVWGGVGARERAQIKRALVRGMHQRGPGGRRQ